VSVGFWHFPGWPEAFQRSQYRGRGDEWISAGGQLKVTRPDPGRTVTGVRARGNGSWEEVILHRGDPCSEEAIRGRVRSSDVGRAVVSLKLPFTAPRDEQTVSPDLIRMLQSGGWFLDRVPFSRDEKRRDMRCTGSLRRARPDVIREVVSGELPCRATETESLFRTRIRGTVHESGRLGTGSCETDALSGPATKRLTASDSCFPEGLHRELNEDQEAAIRASLDSEVFHIVHGPPGTGRPGCWHGWSEFAWTGANECL